MADASIDRLTRIEDKLDKMSEAIVSLARMEERMITLFKRMDTYDAQQSLVSDRLAKVEVAQANTDGSSKWVNIVIIAVITGALSLALFAK
jgi:hypothetical protein